MSIISRFAGVFNAAAYAYGIISDAPPALQVISGSSGTGAYTLTCQPQKNANPNQAVPVVATTTPITVGFGSNAETVTPSAVSTDTLGNVLITATFSNSHMAGEQVRSGSVGLQEALNAASAAGGGIVAVDASWAAGGGTQAMIVAATIPANVGLEDNRFGIGYSAYTYTLTNTQILNMGTTGVELLPAPAATAYWQVANGNLVNLNTGTAYAAGGAITIGYGSTTPTNALSGTVAATFLTTPTATEVIEVGSGLTSATAGTSVLGKGIYITSTAAFTTGTGTLQVTLNAALITV